jgi:hypothetical protein
VGNFGGTSFEEVSPEQKYNSSQQEHWRWSVIQKAAIREPTVANIALKSIGSPVV